MKRYYSIDLLKLMCAFGVVCIHAPFAWDNSGVVSLFCRVAVPVFFMISGFLYNAESNKSQKLKKIKSIFLLCIGVNLFYLAMYSVQAFIGGNLTSYLTQTFMSKYVLNFIFFNATEYMYHLWYISAYLYVLVLMYFLGSVKNKIPLIVVLFMLNALLGEFSKAVLGFQAPNYFTRNFLLTGVPYFLLGQILKNNHEKIFKLGILRSFIFTFFSIMLLLAEKACILSLGLNPLLDHYASLIALSSSFFILFLNICVSQNNVLAIMGKKYSMMIYIIHPLMISVSYAVFNRILMENVFLVIKPVITFIASIIFSIAYYWFKQNICKFIKKIMQN